MSGIPNGKNDGVGEGESYGKLVRIGVAVGDGDSIKEGLWVGVELVGRRVGTGVEIIDALQDNG